MFKSMAYWRVAFVAVLYVGLYAGYKEYAPWWLLAFIIPFFMLFRPMPKDICAFKKAREAGLIFYIFKWGLIWMGILLLLLAYYAITFEGAGSLFEMAKVFIKNSFVIVPLFLGIYMSWTVNSRQYLRECYGKEQEIAPYHKKKKKKRRK